VGKTAHYSVYLQLDNKRRKTMVKSVTHEL
jgi:hypothetical protein